MKKNLNKTLDLIVQKYGGSSLKDARAIKNIADKIKIKTDQDIRKKNKIQLSFTGLSSE